MDRVTTQLEAGVPRQTASLLGGTQAPFFGVRLAARDFADRVGEDLFRNLLNYRRDAL